MLKEAWWVSLRLHQKIQGEKSNIVGCDDRISFFAFKKGLLTEHELTIALSQTLVDVFAMVKCYSFLDDDQISTKKSGKQVNQS